eukprot:scaffold191074_cov19-Tisochrysis_lutea.AAC.1
MSWERPPAEAVCVAGRAPACEEGRRAIAERASNTNPLFSFRWHSGPWLGPLIDPIAERELCDAVVGE